MPTNRRLLFAATGLGGLNVALQIAYPLTHGSTRHALTIASVVVFFLASLAHCVSTRGWSCGAALVAVCVGGGLAAEAIGWRTGWPFGNYRYGNTLGPKLLGVPMVVPLAWAMMGWPALLAGRRSSARSALSGEWRKRLVTAVVGSLVLSSWDLFLDPQMVGAGHWRWLPTPGPWLNGIPLVNSVGWFFVGVLMVGLLDRLVSSSPVSPGADRLIWMLLGWVWFSEIFGHLVFFGRPQVALVGGLATTAVAWIVIRIPALANRRPSP